MVPERHAQESFSAELHQLLDAARHLERQAMCVSLERA
jgi:hypothetical protein